MKKYFVRAFMINPCIEEVEPIRETDKSLWFKSTSYREASESRVAKRTDYDNYFDTWEEAHDFIIKKAEMRFERAIKEMENAKRILERAKNLTKVK